MQLIGGTVAEAVK
jgi:aarF domain-containing kinase